MIEEQWRQTHTGKIYVDTEHKLETVGEAGLQFSINSTDDEESYLTTKVIH